jgi:F-type H+-transporting ATPase subunit epsilon
VHSPPPPLSHSFSYPSLAEGFSAIIDYMDFELITLSGTKINENVYEVMLPTKDGEISVFPGHEDLVTVAKPGVVMVRRNKQDSDSQLELFAISGGIVEINSSRVRVLVDEAEHGEDIVEAQTQAALDRALQLRDAASDQVELEKAHQLVDRHAVRLKVADLQRRHRRR